MASLPPRRSAPLHARRADQGFGFAQNCEGIVTHFPSLVPPVNRSMYLFSKAEPDITSWLLVGGDQDNGTVTTQSGDNWSPHSVKMGEGTCAYTAKKKSNRRLGLWWRCLTRPFRGTRRLPSPGLQFASRATRTPRKLGKRNLSSTTNPTPAPHQHQHPPRLQLLPHQTAPPY
jgi:hypothetical protein